MLLWNQIVQIDSKSYHKKLCEWFVKKHTQKNTTLDEAEETKNDVN